MAHDLFQLLSDRLNRDNLKGAQYLGVFNGAAELPTSPSPRSTYGRTAQQMAKHALASTTP